jgi:hypothetical protein
MKYIKITLAFCFSLVCSCCTFEEPELPRTCGGSIYNSETEFCYYDYIVYKKCGGLEYDPREQKCENDILIEQCGYVDYDETTEFCYIDDVYAKCNEQKYVPTTHFCSNNALYKKCNGSAYYD